MNRYRLLTGTHTVNGVTFKAGDDHLTEEHIKGLTTDRFVMVGPVEGVQQSTRTESSTETAKPSYTPMTADTTETEGKTSDNPTTDSSSSRTVSSPESVTTTTTASETSKDWSKTQDMKATDVIAMIKEEDSDDELKALQKVEEEGQNRIGVMREIDKRLAQLEEEE